VVVHRGVGGKTHFLSTPPPSLIILKIFADVITTATIPLKS
jgi:hypothetical protein